MRLPCAAILCYTVSMEENNTSLITPEFVDESIKELCHLITKVNDEQFIYDFFKCLFTAPELRDFATRWSLVKEIDNGVTQREIAKKYRISLCKITRGSKELSKSDSAFVRMLDLLKKEQKS